MTPAAEVHRVLMQHPGLGAHGFGPPPHERLDKFTERVQAACSRISSARDAARMVEQRGSCVLQHAAERGAGEHVPNGAMIVAALLSGFQAVHGIRGQASLPARAMTTTTADRRMQRLRAACQGKGLAHGAIL